MGEGGTRGKGEKIKKILRVERWGLRSDRW